MLQPQPQCILRALAQSLSAQQSQTGAGQAQSRCSRHDLLIIAMCSAAGVMPFTDQRAESLGAIHFDESHPRAPCTINLLEMLTASFFDASAASRLTFVPASRSPLLQRNLQECQGGRTMFADVITALGASPCNHMTAMLCKDQISARLKLTSHTLTALALLLSLYIDSVHRMSIFDYRAKAVS